MGRDGGTQMYCATCTQVQVCRAVPARDVDWNLESGQRWYHRRHPDLQYFRRGRNCQECGSSWLTVEIPEKFLDELVELRDALAELKTNAETYSRQSDAAADSLKRLKESLGSLRALDLYSKS